MNESKAALRDEVRSLAEEAFQRHLISGYGDGEYPDKFQIIYKGKTRHFLLEKARAYLVSLLDVDANAPLLQILFNRKSLKRSPDIDAISQENDASKATLRDEVRSLAKEAFQHHLISGYGDGEYPDKFQIIYDGKTRHLALERARTFLSNLLNARPQPSILHVLFNQNSSTRPV